MGTQYLCTNKIRRKLVDSHSTINAIDYLEVLHNDAPIGSPQQRTLLVYCFKSVLTLDTDNVAIENGPKNAPVKVLWAIPASQATTGAAVDPAISAHEQAYFQTLPSPDNILVVRTDSEGDFSTYMLRIVTSTTNDLPPADFDSQLSKIHFSFKVECPTDFDCEPDPGCPPEEQPIEPPIDYLAKDYASFRQLMLDQLSVIAPDWRERNTADQGIMLVELLAYAGDHLSYYQDAVATEAYLGTARKRVSVRRHARLLDYFMHDGCNARAWVVLQVDSSRDGDILPGPSISPLDNTPTPGTMLLTKSTYAEKILDNDQAKKALLQGTLAYETMHSITLWGAHNEIHFYTWGDEDCCLPRGATRASLDNSSGNLQLNTGDILILEEVLGSESGLPADADPSHRHVVRLTNVQAAHDDLLSPAHSVMNIEWALEDALLFPLCLKEIGSKPVSVAYGNTVLVDHGKTLASEDLPQVQAGTLYRPVLEENPLTRQGYMQHEEKDGSKTWVTFDEEAPACEATEWKMRNVFPAIWLKENGSTAQVWRPQRNLLGSDRFEREFVVESEERERAYLRFGGGDMPGREPASDINLDAVYRVGNGKSGNVGAEAIAHVVEWLPGISGVTKVRNPLPSIGGVEPEAIEEVQLYAPHAFRTQERAVTEEDYAEVAERHGAVQKAAATLRWTGSWHTMFVTVDRIGGLPVDEAFEDEIHNHLGVYRMAGHDLEIDGPRYVGLEIELVVCVKADYFNSDVKDELLSIFSNMDLIDGRRGFFQPDNLTFGQSVYLSQVLATAMDVQGVAWINLDDARTRFGRLGYPSDTAIDQGYISMGRLEIARLDNDRSAPERGKINFHMYGGL